MTNSRFVEFRPYSRNGEHVVAVGMTREPTLMVGMSPTTYHDTRAAILNMRTRDPSLGSEMDAYLSALAKNSRNPEGFSGELIAELLEKLEKHGLGLGGTVLDVAKDLKAHGYNPAYLPPVMIDVNGRPMHPFAVIDELLRHDVAVSGQLLSADKGKVSGAMSFDKASLAKAVVKAVDGLRRKSSEDLHMRLGENAANIFAQVTAHAGGVVSLLTQSNFGARVAFDVGLAKEASTAEVGRAALGAAAPGLGPK